MKTIHKFYSNSYFSLLAVCLGAVFLAGCDKKNNDIDIPGGASSIPYINLVNAAQTSGPLDAYIGSALVSTNLLYGKYSGYIAASPIAYNVFFNTPSSVNTVGSGNVTLATSTVNDIYFTDDNSVVAITEDRTRPQTGKARVGFVQLSTLYNTGPLDVYIKGGAKLASGIYYKNASSYVDIDPSVTSFSLTTGGSSAILLNMQLQLIPDNIYTIYITGVAGRTLDYHVFSTVQ